MNHKITITSKVVWTDKLFSFTTTRPDGFRFHAGQFVSLKLPVDAPSVGDEMIARPYSIVSSPYAEELEFFSVVVPDGAFTSKLKTLSVGDELYLDEQPYGFLTLARYQEPKAHDLWLLATGTGLAPFLSMLQDMATWSKYKHIMLAYSVSHQAELAYVDKIGDIAEQFSALVDEPATFTFIPIVTREQTDFALSERLPKLLVSGELAQSAQLPLEPSSAHIMLCGNPQMVEDTKETLKAMGFSMNRRGVGNITVENYW